MTLGVPREAESPPIANRGVYPSIGGVPVPQFDWYGATVCAHHDAVLDVVEQALLDAGEDTVRTDGGKVRRYGAITFITDRKGRKLAAVKHGGYPFPHLEAEGSAAPAVAEALRATGWVHKPTRIDSCVDITRPGLLDDLHTIMREFEAKHGLHLNYAGAALDNPERGTTIYLGSRKSQVFLRAYEKGRQLAEQQGIDPRTLSPEMQNWVRVELVFRPDKPHAKAFASAISPEGVWGVSSWSQEFAKRALSLNAERVKLSQRRESDHERALRHMAGQYRLHLQRLLHECGGDYAQAFAVLADLADLSQPLKAA